MFDKPMGGTELMYNELIRRLPDSYKEHFSIFNYISQADFSKTTIYWNQLSYDQNAVQFLNDPQYVDKIDWFVFVSHWQAEMYRKVFRIPGYKTHVIRNGCLEVEERVYGQRDKVRLCYTSTPWRGLDVLLKAWKLLQPIDCELHVFSSSQIYGKEFASRETSDIKALYQECLTTPGVVYRGSIPNDQLRAELPTFDIMAYPCTFEETSCIAVIEALSAGLKVVTSSIGALPETTCGWAKLYSFLEDKNLHAERFAKVLSEEIELIKRGKYKDFLKGQAHFYRNMYAWDVIYYLWKEFLVSCIVSKKKIKARNTWEVDIFRECYLNNEYGLETLNPEDVVIDLGVHIGSFSILAHHKGSRNIHGYEVSDSNYKVALENTASLSGVHLNKIAVWRSDDNRKTVNFDTNIVDWNTGMGIVGNTPRTGSVEVECVKFDDVLDKFDSIRFVKIDVESSEYPILYTSKQLHKIREIAGEYHNFVGNINGYGCNGQELKRFLEDQGFTVTKLEKASWSNDCGFFKAIKNI